MKVHFSKLHELQFRKLRIMLYLYVTEEEKDKKLRFAIFLRLYPFTEFLAILCAMRKINGNKFLRSASSFRMPLVNFKEISCGRANGRSRGVPWRPCRFPIKQMPAGTRATPQAPASISPCSLGVRQRICPSLSLALLAREGFDRRTCRAACETRAGFTTCAFHSSYTYLQKLHWT